MGASLPQYYAWGLMVVAAGPWLLGLLAAGWWCWPLRVAVDLGGGAVGLDLAVGCLVASDALGARAARVLWVRGLRWERWGRGLRSEA